MKTETIIRALRNQNSPRANFARWMNQPLRKRLQTFQKSKESEYAWPKALTIDGPELSSPECENPLLWEYPPAEITLCDDLFRVLSHTGWYTDNYCEETLKPAVASLPEFRKLIFAATEASAFGSTKIHLDCWEEIDFDGCESYYDASDARKESMRSVLRMADSIAEREAEEERDYRMKEDAKIRADELIEERKALGCDLRELIHSLRNASNLPATLCKELRGNVKSYVAQRQALLTEALELRDDPSSILPSF